MKHTIVTKSCTA